MTKNLSELCRTQKLSQMGCDKKSIRTLSDLEIGTNVTSQKKPIQNFSDLKFFIMTQKLFGKFRNRHVCQV